MKHDPYKVIRSVLNADDTKSAEYQQGFKDCYRLFTIAFKQNGILNQHILECEIKKLQEDVEDKNRKIKELRKTVDELNKIKRKQI